MMEDRIVGESLNQEAAIAYAIFGFLIILSGVLGNVFLLLVLATRRKLREDHNIFVANLALADFVVVSLLPFMVLDLVLGYQPVVNMEHCKWNGFILNLAYSVSISSLVSISFNRYMKVCHTKHFHRLFSLKKNILYTLGLWAMGCLFHTPYFAGHPPFGYDAGSHCYQGRAVRNKINYGGMTMSVVLVVPIFTIGYFNYAIFHKWSASKAKFKNKKKSKNEEIWQSAPSLPHPTQTQKNTGEPNSSFYIEFSDVNGLSSEWDKPPPDQVLLHNREEVDIPKRANVLADPDMTCPTQSENNTLQTRNDQPQSTNRRLHTQNNPADDTYEGITPACNVSNDAADNTGVDYDIAGEPDSKTKYTKNKVHVSRAEVALIRSLLVIFICLLVLYAPFAVCLLADYGIDIPTELMVFVALLLFVNCAVNWVIYGVMNTSFREGYAITIRRLKCGCCACVRQGSR